jgi:DNA-binding transcriptional MerR regulator
VLKAVTGKTLPLDACFKESLVHNVVELRQLHALCKAVNTGTPKAPCRGSIFACLSAVRWRFSNFVVAATNLTTRNLSPKLIQGWFTMSRQSDFLGCLFALAIGAVLIGLFYYLALKTEPDYTIPPTSELSPKEIHHYRIIYLVAVKPQIETHRAYLLKVCKQYQHIADNLIQGYMTLAQARQQLNKLCEEVEALGDIPLWNLVNLPQDVSDLLSDAYTEYLLATSELFICHHLKRRNTDLLEVYDEIKGSIKAAKKSMNSADELIAEAEVKLGIH